MTLPEATPKPCSECPWVRTSTPGDLGPMSPEEWTELAHGEPAIACHMTIKATDDHGYGDWSNPAMRQCRGAAIFRANICKRPRDPEVAVGPVDRELVFGWDGEFQAHHGPVWYCTQEIAEFAEEEAE